MNDLLSKEPHIKSIKQLEVCVGRIFDDMNENHVDYFEKLYASLPARVAEVIANKGGPTKH